jgi:hypothetical protein
MSKTEAGADPYEGMFDKFAADAVSLTKKLGLPEGFLLELLKDDDWSFVVKAHGVLEVALRKAVSENCFSVARRRDEARLARYASDLPFDGRTSKLALAEAFGLVSADAIKQMRALSRMRNLFVHDITRVGLSIRTLVADLPDKESFLQQAVRVPLTGIVGEMTDGALRLMMLFGLVMSLWEIDFRSQPPPSLWQTLMGAR